MDSIIVGMFDNQTQAEEARMQLLQAGISQSSISLHASQDTTGTSYGSMQSATAAHESEGGIAHFFHSLFGSDDASQSEHAANYGEAMRRGAYGLTVRVNDATQLERAETIMNETGAVDIDQRSQEWRAQGWTPPLHSADADMTSSSAGSATSKTLPLIEEELQVGKRTVARGGVRIFNKIVETPVEESVLLREEHADVQRRTVNRPVTPADLAAFKEGTIEVTESAEEVVVGKESRVVGEVEIGKHVTEHEEKVHDTLRKTVVEVEQIDSAHRPEKS